ncbi:hypothetical protein X777_11760 [Ooceraea biroi]|uniref:Uncharacterized protein n=1 Tax=Ooceraea biroi TaxID=2015173 RepID=A0A026X059_OOCBI|nr:hypothetical protein X777_11760 [Ooceraea biroi]
MDDDDDDDAPTIVYVKGLEKRGWLRNLLLDDDIYIETIDAHYEDIPSLNKLDVTHTLRCNKHVSHCALQNVFKMFNWWSQQKNKIYYNSPLSYTLIFYIFEENSFIHDFFSHSVLPTRPANCILSRRYALTATGYKYLEIVLYGQRLNIQYHLYHDVRGRPISVGPLTVRFSESPACDNKLIYPESSNIRLAMTDSTFFSMLNLDRCIDLMFDHLNRMVDKVDTKFAQYSNMASTNPKNVSNAIRASDCFDENHLIDCELLALVFSKLHI